MIFNFAFGECQINLNQNPNIAVSKNMIIIDGQTYYVKGSDNKTRFESLLLECHATESAKYFKKWRNSRGWTKGMLTWGILFGAPIFAVVPAIIGNSQKNQMTEALYIELSQDKSI